MSVAQRVAPERGRSGLAFAALVLGACAMGASPIFVRLADVGPYASAFWRTFLALPFLWAWARLEAGAFDRENLSSPSLRAEGEAIQSHAPGGWIASPSARNDGNDFFAGSFAGTSGNVNRSAGLGMMPVVLAGLFFAGDLFFWHLSILATTVANATFLATTSPIWVALGAWLMLSERIGARTLAGLGLCFAGGFALVGESYGFAPERVKGDVFGLVTAIFFGLYILALRAARAGYGAARLTFLSTAITALCLFVIAMLFDSAVLPRSWSGVAALLALALISQVGGQGLLAVALGTLPATFSSMVIFLEAIAAAAFAWAILGEALGWVQALGGFLILAGIWTARPRAAAEVRP